MGSHAISHFIKFRFIRPPRLVSVFCGYLTIIGLWYAGFLLKDKRTGYLAAALGLITPFLFYDRFAVMESMLTASGIWLFNIAYLLAKSRRLDVALIFGVTAGLAFLVKSPAQVFILLIPSAYLFMQEDKTRFSKQNIAKYIPSPPCGIYPRRANQQPPASLTLDVYDHPQKWRLCHLAHADAL